MKYTMLHSILEEALTESNKDFISFGSEACDSIIVALDNAFIRGTNTVPTNHYAEMYPHLMKDITYALSELGFCTSIVKSNWTELKLIPEKLLEYRTNKELTDYRTKKRLNKYLMRKDDNLYLSLRVKSGKNIVNTGIKRPGFKRVAKEVFQLDATIMEKYLEPITLNAIKSMEKAKVKADFYEDPANYSSIVKECLAWYMNNPDKEFNLEQNNSDTRGRSIFKGLKRVFNPVSSKDARACLIAPAISLDKTNELAMNDIFYFIAELNGSKANTEVRKINDGKIMYANGELPNLDLSTSDGRKDLHNLIWLERIYSKLDELYASSNGSIEWNIPVEIDASMSIAQFVGALTNETRLLEKTNVVGNTLTDPWHIEGVRRKAAKAVGTPTFYGSSQPAIKLIKDDGLNPDKEELKRINKEFSKGAFSIMRMFKDAIISNYTVKSPEIRVKIWNDNFIVPVNKFKPAGSKIQLTTAWDTKDRKFRIAKTHKPILIPDYVRMKLFWATCLIHNLDSQVMDAIARKITKWMLTIHDAVITMPGTAKECREQYVIELNTIRQNRHQILKDFRESIGATSFKADVDFMKLHKAVEQLDDTVKFNATAMK